jgi:hypothetical protein
MPTKIAINGLGREHRPGADSTGRAGIRDYNSSQHEHGCVPVVSGETSWDCLPQTCWRERSRRKARNGWAHVASPNESITRNLTFWGSELKPARALCEPDSALAEISNSRD